MTWFKVDDGVYDHPKFLGLSMAARGLWMTCGAWCSKHLTDGVIPARQVTQLGGTRNQVEALIRHGLWVQTQGDSGGKSYAFHGWNDMQPTRKEILENREAERERKREWREKKAAKQGERENVPPGRDAGQDVGHPRPVRSTRPDPSRPDPSRPTTRGEVASSAHGDHGAGAELLAAVDSAVRDRPDCRPGLTSTARRLIAQGAPEADVLAGIAAWAVRPDAGPALLPDLVRDAAAERDAAEADRQRRQAVASRKAQVDACRMCDDNGWILLQEPAVKCTHDPAENERRCDEINTGEPDDPAPDRPLHGDRLLAALREIQEGKSA